MHAKYKAKEEVAGKPPPGNKGGLVAGATKHTKQTLQYTTIAALKANDGLDLIGLFEWYGKNPTGAPTPSR
jgi:hypothetical protein